MTGNNFRQEMLLIDPLFMHVLDKEFRPSSDTARRAHTLGKLVDSAWKKGEPGPARDQEELILGNFGILKAYTYNPSWAPNVEVRDFVRIDDRNPMFEVMSGVILRSNLGDSLAISHDPFANTAGITNEDAVTLEVGPSLTRLRQHIASTALEFFERARGA